MKAAILLFLITCNAYALTLAYVDFPPYEFQEDGKAKGILVEIVKTVFKRADVPLKLTFLPFKRAYHSVQNGEIDGLFNFFKTPERLKLFDYSKPLIKNPLVYFVRKESKLSIDKLSDLRGLRVGVMLGYTYGTKFDEATFFRKDKGTGHAGNLKKLIFERIDLYPCDKLVCMYIALENNLLPTLKVLPKPLRVMEGHIGFTKGKHRQTLKKINRVIEQMVEKGEIDQMINRFIGSM